MSKGTEAEKHGSQRGWGREKRLRRQGFGGNWRELGHW